MTGTSTSTPSAPSKKEVVKEKIRTVAHNAVKPYQKLYGALIGLTALAFGTDFVEGSAWELPIELGVIGLTLGIVHWCKNHETIVSKFETATGIDINQDGRVG